MSGEIAGVLSGALMQEMRLDVLANNIANVNTVGFKGDRLFRIPDASIAGSDMLQGETGSYPANVISSLPLGTFTSFDQGPLKETGNALDLALDGDGFFSVKTPEGTQYTRKGNFTLNASSTLVTQEGYPVLGTGGGEIRITGQQVSINSNGEVQVDGQLVSSLEMVDFPDKKKLLKKGDSLYSPVNPNDQGVPAAKTQVHQRFIEESNVDSIKMMTEMIDVIRGYESYQKVLQSMNDTNSRAVNEIGKLS